MARPIVLNKTYYYHRWLDSQGILFSVFPELTNLYEKLLDVVTNLSKLRHSRMTALTEGNAIIGTELAAVMNGRSLPRKPFYQGTES